MKLNRICIVCALMLIAATAHAGQEKILVCHVGNETGPGGETYLDDPGCVPGEANDDFCPDAGKIDLILVSAKAKHIGNESHSFGGFADYEPLAGAGDLATDFEDGSFPPDGIDDGCELEPESCEDFSTPYGTCTELGETCMDGECVQVCGPFADEFCCERNSGSPTGWSNGC